MNFHIYYNGAWIESFSHCINAKDAIRYVKNRYSRQECLRVENDDNEIIYDGFLEG